MNTTRLTSLSREGEVVTAEGQATGDGLDDLRTFWFTSLGALAHAQHLGGSFIVRRVLDGTTLIGDPDEPEDQPVGTLTDPAKFLSEEDLTVYAFRWADGAEAIVEEVNYVPFFGGGAEFVVRPKDELDFMRELDLRMYEFFCGLPREETGHPFLLTFVDGSGANRRVQGGFYLGDERDFRLSDGTKASGGGSEGFAGQAADLTKALGVDAGGRPIDLWDKLREQPVEGLPTEEDPSYYYDLFYDTCKDWSSESAARGLGVPLGTQDFAEAFVAEWFGDAPSAEDAARAAAAYEGCMQGFRDKR